MCRSICPAPRPFVSVLGVCRVEIAHPAIYDVGFRMPGEHVELMLQLVRAKEVVGVEELHELAGCGSEARVPRRRGPGGCLTHGGDPAIGSGQHRRDLRGPVSGAVIHHDAFPVRVVLAAQRVDC